MSLLFVTSALLPNSLPVGKQSTTTSLHPRHRRFLSSSQLCHTNQRRHVTRPMSMTASNTNTATKSNGDETQDNNHNDKNDITYASSGVNIDTEASSVQALISALRHVPPCRSSGTMGASVPHTGGFSGMIEFGDSYLALCTDGVGSKMQLAAQLNRYDSVGIDCVAMNVNDLLCIGAEPLAFVDYIAAPKPNPQTWHQLGMGLANGCAQARVTLCGGETASLPDMVTHVDMSGTALGHLQRGAQLDGSRIRVGDVIIGLPASGVHSNGLSLVRKIVDVTNADLNNVPPFEADNYLEHQRAGGKIYKPNTNNNNNNNTNNKQEKNVTLGDVLINPTRIYVDPVVDLLKSCRQNESPCTYDSLRGMVHVTGGGLSNFLRLNPNIGFRITDPLPILPEFSWLQQSGNISDFEMYRTFNMGMGFALIVSKESASSIVRFLSDKLPGSRIVGDVTDKSGKITHFPRNVTFDKY